MIEIVFVCGLGDYEGDFFYQVFVAFHGMGSGPPTQPHSEHKTVKLPSCENVISHKMSAHPLLMNQPRWRNHKD